MAALYRMCLTERIYGRDTEEHRQDDLKKMVDRMKTCVDQDPTIKRVPSKSTKAGTNSHRGTEGTERKAETKTEVSGSRVQGSGKHKATNKRRDAEDAEQKNDEAKGEVDDGDDETQPEGDGEVAAEVDPRIAEAEAMIVSQNPDGDPVLHAANMAQTEYRYVPGYSELRDSELLESGELTPEEHQERKQQREWQKWYNRQNQIAREQEQEEQWFNPYA